MLNTEVPNLKIAVIIAYVAEEHKHMMFKSLNMQNPYNVIKFSDEDIKNAQDGAIDIINAHYKYPVIIQNEIARRGKGKWFGKSMKTIAQFREIFNKDLIENWSTKGWMTCDSKSIADIVIRANTAILNNYDPLTPNQSDLVGKTVMLKIGRKCTVAAINTIFKKVRRVPNATPCVLFWAYSRNNPIPSAIHQALYPEVE
jgi:hypothetical protein